MAETAVLGGCCTCISNRDGVISRSVNEVHLHFQACSTWRAGNTRSLCSKVKTTVVPISLGWAGGLRPKEAGKGDQGHRATV